LLKLAPRLIKPAEALQYLESKKPAVQPPWTRVGLALFDRGQRPFIATRNVQQHRKMKKHIGLMVGDPHADRAFDPRDGFLESS
jgi:hypothetical protein